MAIKSHLMNRFSTQRLLFYVVRYSLGWRLESHQFAFELATRKLLDAMRQWAVYSICFTLLWRGHSINIFRCEISLD